MKQDEIPKRKNLCCYPQLVNIIKLLKT